MIDAEPRLKPVVPTSINIVCYRYQPAGVSNDKLKAINTGQIVNLRGYLAKATIPSTGWYWRSAMDNGDIMVGLGCKLIYVQTVDILG